MLYISIDNLKPGMTLAKEVWGASSFLPLLHTQVALTQSNINYLRQRNVSGAYIDFGDTDDIIIPKEIFTTEQKVKMTAAIQDITNKFCAQNGSIFSSVKAFDKIADYMASAILDSKECMLNLVEIKNYNDYTYVHSMQVGILSAIIGKKLEFSDERVKSLALAGILHDVGKLKIPKEILEKTTRLTESEFCLLKKHPEHAYQKLAGCSSLSTMILDGVSCHHEKYNGAGYPYGLKGDEIPLFAKIIAVADVYDALTSPRSYRDAWEPRDAVDYLLAHSGTQFDTNILKAFLSSVAAYPVGVMVELSTGDVGVVIKTQPGFPLTPVVKLLSPWSRYGAILDLTSDASTLTVRIVSTIKDTTKINEALNNSQKSQAEKDDQSIDIARDIYESVKPMDFTVKGRTPTDFICETVASTTPIDKSATVSMGVNTNSKPIKLKKNVIVRIRSVGRKLGKLTVKNSTIVNKKP